MWRVLYMVCSVRVTPTGADGWVSISSKLRFLLAAAELLRMFGGIGGRIGFERIDGVLGLLWLGGAKCTFSLHVVPQLLLPA